MVVILVTAIYLAASSELYVRGVLHLVPFPRRPRVREVLERAGNVLQRWALGQLVDMMAVGFLAGAGLWILGVPLPFALGVLSGLLTFIPYFGAILAAVPAILLAFTVSGPTPAWAGRCRSGDDLLNHLAVRRIPLARCARGLLGVLHGGERPHGWAGPPSLYRTPELAPTKSWHRPVCMGQGIMPRMLLAFMRMKAAGALPPALVCYSAACSTGSMCFLDDVEMSCFAEPATSSSFIFSGLKPGLSTTSNPLLHGAVVASSLAPSSPSPVESLKNWSTRPGVGA